MKSKIGKYILIFRFIEDDNPLVQYRTNELVRRRMNFSSDAMADFEGLLEVNRKICKQQMAEKASPTLPTNCAVLPLILSVSLCPDFYIKKCRAISA